MDSIRIQNLRSLKDSGRIEIRPLVLLVGANSSGKSTFLRTFPLLKQSLEVKKKGPLLWYGPEVDFGSFGDAITTGEKIMSFEIYFSDETTPRRASRYRAIHLNKLSFEVTRFRKHDHVSQFLFEMENGQVISAKIEGENASVTINNKNLSSEINSFDIKAFDSYGLIPNLLLVSRSEDNVSDTILRAICNFIKDQTSFDIDPAALEKKIGIYASFLSKEEIKKAVLELLPKMEQQDSIMVINSVYDYLTLRDLNEIIDAVNMQIRFKFGEVKYIKPIRASAERYYRVQNLSVDELDSDGHNLAMFINDLYSDRKTKGKFQEWTKENFGFIVEAKEKNGQVSLQILDSINNGFVNIADTGAGYAQLLPIIVKMWQTMEQKSSRLLIGYGDSTQCTFFAIEQPELHLHPNLQVRFADALVAMLRKNPRNSNRVKAIVETHSKDIIGRIGLCVERGHISSEDVIVLLFDENHIVRQSFFDKNGILQDWPIGFFDPE